MHLSNHFAYSGAVLEHKNTPKLTREDDRDAAKQDVDEPADTAGKANITGRFNCLGFSL